MKKTNQNVFIGFVYKNVEEAYRKCGELEALNKQEYISVQANDNQLVVLAKKTLENAGYIFESERSSPKPSKQRG